ncbi:MAG: response regulator [Alphaproteobacteria bacterium]|jgi:signal transduction histidine kinase|nr:response regulator [Alphaproteobacteria bacterium]
MQRALSQIEDAAPDRPNGHGLTRDAAPNVIRLLVVDDNEDDYTLTKVLLEHGARSVYQVDWAESFEAGFRMLTHEAYDAALIDHLLPPRSGAELVRLLGGRLFHTPLILFSGADDPAIDEEASEAGVFDFLQKDDLTPRILDRTIRFARQAHRLEHELRAALAEARDANHAKSRFLAAMSHELRTPLNSIIGFAELIKDEVTGPHGEPRQVEYAGDILSSGQHLLALINDILDLSKIEANKFTINHVPVNLYGILRSCLRLVMPQAQQTELDIRLDFQKDMPVLWGDERAVKQMVGNLLSNSVKFTPPGGTVTVRACAVSPSEIAIAVEDTGPGIPVDQIGRLLQPFEQLEEQIELARQGTGLGLPLVKGLADLHHGRLDIRSEPGHGTTVTIYLPVGHGQPPAAGRLALDVPTNLC